MMWKRLATRLAIVSVEIDNCTVALGLMDLLAGSDKTRVHAADVSDVEIDAWAVGVEFWIQTQIAKLPQTPEHSSLFSPVIHEVCPEPSGVSVVASWVGESSWLMDGQVCVGGRMEERKNSHLEMSPRNRSGTKILASWSMMI